MANLSLKNLVKSYGDVKVLHDVSLEIDDGEFVVFLGPSGCGKTTLMRMIAGLEDITGGELIIDGDRVNDVPPAQRGIAMVFQSYALYPHMTLFDNMAFGLKLAGTPKAEIREAVHRAAEILRIEHLLDRKPRQLSGGQRQRVAIGRAITRKPKVFLFDEPLSNLDASLRVQMRLEFSRLHQQLKTTMIYVTHDQIEAMTLADKIVVLHDGVLQQVGSPEIIYYRPANRFVAAFIGSPKMNFIDGTVGQVGDRGVEVKLGDGGTQWASVAAGSAREGAKVTLGLRAEHLLIADDGPIPAKVLTVESLGDSAYLYAESELAPDGLVARIPPLKRYAPGAAVRLSVKPEHCHLFDAEGQAFERNVDLELAA